MFKFLKVEKKENIGFLKLSRPEQLNALSREVLKELIEVAHRLDQQTDIKVVIISGEGRAFSAGADLKDFQAPSQSQASWMERREEGQLGYRMTDAIANMRAITIAQVHGFAIGGAFLLMLACDLRIAEENAFFAIPEVDLGIPLTWGGIPKLVAEIGPAKTKELVMTCRRFRAEEAESLGLINQIVQPEELDDYCQKLATELSEKPAVPLLMTKEQVNAASDHMGAGYVASAEGDMLQSVLKDPEAMKAAKAYMAKRMKNK